MNELATFQSKIGAVAWQRLLERLAEANRHIRQSGIRSMSNLTSNLAGVGSELLTGYSYGKKPPANITTRKPAPARVSTPSGAGAPWPA